MNRKIIFIVVAITLLGIVVFGSIMTDNSIEASEEYDSAYYVENSGNLFIKIAKFADKCCFYIIDIFVSGIASIFNSFLGG